MFEAAKKRYPRSSEESVLHLCNDSEEAFYFILSVGS
jgi:hypothetical protein